MSQKPILWRPPLCGNCLADMALDAKPVLVLYWRKDAIRAFHAETYSCLACQRAVIVMEQEGFDITDAVVGMALSAGVRIVEMEGK